MKDVFGYDERVALLKDAFTVDRKQTNGKTLLGFDDLYRSGATASAIARLLTAEGGAKAVYLFTLTVTRSAS